MNTRDNEHLVLDSEADGGQTLADGIAIGESVDDLFATSMSVESMPAAHVDPVDGKIVVRP